MFARLFETSESATDKKNTSRDNEREMVTLIFVLNSSMPMCCGSKNQSELRASRNHCQAMRGRRMLFQFKSSWRPLVLHSSRKEM